MATSTPTLERLQEVAAAAGLHRLGCTSADPFLDTRRTIQERKDQGLHGSMQFTYRNPERSTDPERTLPGARTILVGARSYHRHRPAPVEGRGPVARVARYVWADDQELLLAGLEEVAAELRAAGHRTVVLSDQNHLVDRAAAHRAGLGWFGKNANLLLPGAGSWFILGAVLTDAEVRADDGAPLQVVPDGCGPCTRCISACPTDAIVAPGVVDARRCLSWTLQSTGTFPVDQRVALADRIYGCDDCQDVCPPNKREVLRVEPGGRGHLEEHGDPEKAWVPLLDLLDATDQELLATHGRWYVPKRDPRYLRRNALVVLGNVGDGADPRVRAALGRALGDADPLIRSHAVWSARRLGCDDLLVTVHDDADPTVRAELELTVPPAAGGVPSS